MVFVIAKSQPLGFLTFPYCFSIFCFISSHSHLYFLPFVCFAFNCLFLFLKVRVKLIDLRLFFYLNVVVTIVNFPLNTT
jgi:hypothetical protein